MPSGGEKNDYWHIVCFRIGGDALHQREKADTELHIADVRYQFFVGSWKYGIYKVNACGSMRKGMLFFVN